MTADTDHDGKISITEWLALWEGYKKELVARERESEDFLARWHQGASNPDFRALGEAGAKLGDVGEWDEGEQRWRPRKLPVEEVEGSILPSWLHDYLRYRFDLLDRTGDQEIDTEEYQYVLTEFGVRDRDARQAFQIFSHHQTVRVDFPYFVKLFEEYYLSDNPADLGNFVNGKLEFPLELEEEQEVQEAELTFEEQVAKGRDDLMEEGAANNEKSGKQPKGRKKTMKKVKKWFEKNVLHLPET